MTYHDPTEPYLPAIADQVAARVRDTVQAIRDEAGIDAKTALPCVNAYDAAYLAWSPICREVYGMCEPLFTARSVCVATALGTVENLFRALVVKLLTMHDPQLGAEWVERVLVTMLDRYISPNREGECFLDDPTENRTN